MLSTKNRLVMKPSLSKMKQTSKRAVMKQPELTYYRLLQHFDPATAVGMLANINIESANTYDYKHKQTKPGKGYGLFQFDFMKPLYFKWLKENDLVDSASHQILFVKKVIDGESPGGMQMNRHKRQALNDAIQTSRPIHIAQAFMNNFEAPGKPQRRNVLKSAMAFLNKDWNAYK